MSHLTPHPGSAPYPADLAARLETALQALPAGYAPRTRHYDGREHPARGEHAPPEAPPGSRPVYTNRLLLESSPYLRQHAHNPVDWRPWGPEAFAEANARGVPLFLSVGYSTCHWCHVMEHESFEDLAIAAVLNERYVPVKVDREERPDVDAVYMAAVQAIQGGGGWPMSVWLAPGPGGGTDGLPFFAGTYFPPHDGARGARRGFLSLLGQLADVYREDPDRVAAHAEEVARAVRAQFLVDLSADAVGTEATDAVVRELDRAFDEVHGGRRTAPKFPSHVPIQLLLRHHLRTGSDRSRHMARLTLERMARGGLYDQVGGGWHRYSTDAQWFAPHFEKMLYDQALIILAALDVWQVDGEPEIERAVRETLDYLLREMRHGQGGFFSATDADSEGVEGLYFTWPYAELHEVLGPAEVEVFAPYFGATPAGNWEHGRNILARITDLDEAAARAGQTTDAFAARMRADLDRLYERRQQRVPPLRDDKILASWNGLAISALARAGWLLAEARYTEAAAGAARFLLDHLRADDGRMRRAWLDGTTHVAGFLDDHAFVVQGLLDLYEASHDVGWLEAALSLQDVQDRLFADPERGGWFATAADAETLLARGRPDHDGAEPSGNSVGAGNLVRLAALTGEARYAEAARRTLRAFSARLRTVPAALTEMLLAVEALAWPLREVVLVAPEGQRAALQPFAAALRQTFAPHRVLLATEEGAPLQALAAVAPSVRDKVARDGQATAYVCVEGACRLPTQDPAEMIRQLLDRSRS